MASRALIARVEQCILELGVDQSGHAKVSGAVSTFRVIVSPSVRCSMSVSPSNNPATFAATGARDCLREYASSRVVSEMPRSTASGNSVRAFQNLRIAVGQPPDQIRMNEHDGHQVVEVMGHAARQLSDSFQSLRPTESFLRLVAFQHGFAVAPQSWPPVPGLRLPARPRVQEIVVLLVCRRWLDSFSSSRAFSRMRMTFLHRIDGGPTGLRGPRSPVQARWYHGLSVALQGCPGCLIRRCRSRDITRENRTLIASMMMIVAANM